MTGWAQTPFSLVNLGGNVENYDARMDGRGGWGMAESDTLVPGFKNMAGLTSLKHVAILLSGYLESRLSETTTTLAVDNRRTYRLLTPNVRVAIPIKGQFGALTAGFRARRATEYMSVFPNSWQVNGDVELGETQFQREGTQFEIPLGAAVRLMRGVHIAASLNLLDGSIREKNTTLFVETGYLPSERVKTDEFSGTSTSFFLLLEPFGRLGIGGSYTPEHEVTVDRKILLNGVAQTSQSSFQFTMPREWSAGVALGIGPRWKLGVDYDFREYSKLNGYDVVQNEEDEWTWSAGIERLGARAREAGWDNLPIRLGAMRRHWGYRVGDVNVPGAVQPVEETRVSVGTGFPFSNGMGQLDIAVTYGWVGDKAENGNEDRVWRLSFSIAGLEKWW